MCQAEVISNTSLSLTLIKKENIMKKSFTFGVIFICMVSLLMSCGSTSSDSDSTTTTSSGTFNSPSGIYTDGTYVFVADTGSNTIRYIVISGGSYAILAGSTSGTAGFSNGTGTAALFNAPSGITSDGTNLYVVDKGNNVIRKIVISTGVVTTFAGSTAGASGFTDGTGTAALFNAPSGVTSDGTSLYISDAGNNSIRQIVIATAVVTTL
jgi:hypothetical protein